MAFTNLATATYTTERSPAPSGLQVADPVAHLTGVKFVAVMPAETTTLPHDLRQALAGQSVVLWEAYTEEHLHTDGGTPVTQVPDILTGDFIINGSTRYEVRRVEVWPETAAYKGFLRLILEESR